MAASEVDAGPAPADAEHELPGSVSVQLLSGQSFDLGSPQPGQMVGEICRLLEERRPLEDGTKYELFAGDRALQPEEAPPQRALTAVVTKLSLLQRVAGSWRKEAGDHYFVGLRIQEDGAYECNSGRVRDGLLRIVSEEGRRVNLRRTINGANDHMFEVSEDARQMKGHCPQSGCRWTLVKET
uniref:Uncharacterized protein n=1 Tax=Alexandrium monilatum TaxID=311494 RepID=A0A7S4SAQ6_9DINO|mmetsp:Transcript_95116/g.293265  ORF Transcript_95116/g.293265 Transcript_95116/m.293265 type:complete len:183 (+) Transcript_95116:114-662(+)